MTPEAKGIYPNWVNDKDIITQVLNEIVSEGGRLPYTYVINPKHSPDIQARMKSILDRMQKEKLILRPADARNLLEIDIEGSWAVHVGYKRYKRIKKWNSLHPRLNHISLIIIAIFILLIAGLLLYWFMRHFKIL